MMFSIVAICLAALTTGVFAKPAGVVLGYQDSQGQYGFGYSGPHQARSEVRSLDGITRGSYSYVDSAGLIQSADYTADGQHGFQITATNLPQAPLPVQDTLDVASAKAAHLLALDEAARSAQAPLESDSVTILAKSGGGESTLEEDTSSLITEPEKLPIIEDAPGIEETAAAKLQTPLAIAEAAADAELEEKKKIEAEEKKEIEAEEKMQLEAEEKMKLEAEEEKKLEAEEEKKLEAEEKKEIEAEEKMRLEAEEKMKLEAEEEKKLEAEEKKEIESEEKKEIKEGASAELQLKEEKKEIGTAFGDNAPVALVIASRAASLAVPLSPINFELPTISAYSLKAAQILPQANPAQGSLITPASTTLKTLPTRQLLELAPNVVLAGEPALAQIDPASQLTSAARDLTQFERARAVFAPVGTPVSVLQYGYEPTYSSYLRYAPFPYVTYNIL